MFQSWCEFPSVEKKQWCNWERGWEEVPEHTRCDVATNTVVAFGGGTASVTSWHQWQTWGRGHRRWPSEADVRLGAWERLLNPRLPSLQSWVQTVSWRRQWVGEEVSEGRAGNRNHGPSFSGVEGQGEEGPLDVGGLNVKKEQLEWFRVCVCVCTWWWHMCHQSGQALIACTLLSPGRCQRS